MLFNSVSFLLFFPAVLLVNFALPHRARPLWLLAASYYFYMRWNPAYALLMLTSTAITYLSGLLIRRMRRRAKLWVALSFLSNLGILFFFKYYRFAAESLTALLWRFGVTWQAPVVDVLLPVGISFYTFQALSYTMDVYRGDVEAETSFLRYALFVSFFPQLVAGPIERSGHLLSQLAEKRPFDPEKFKSGALLMLWGYFQKMVIADRAALVVDQVYGCHEAYAGWTLVLATVLFAVQIYCDFGGYSAIAIGASRILGVELMQNFRQPYFARSVSEFWRRWHISLSTWFRDYLYIPLGGNRRGVLRKYLNLMITFVLSGLWHGANWTYVAWGALNGAFQIIGDAKNRLLKTQRRGQSFSLRLLQRAVTFALICFTWVFFRAASMGDALCILRSMFSVNNLWIFTDGTLKTLGLTTLEWVVLAGSIGVLWAVDAARERGAAFQAQLARQPIAFRWMAYVCAIVFILLFGVYGVGFDAGQFIYFQF